MTRGRQGTLLGCLLALLAVGCQPAARGGSPQLLTTIAQVRAVKAEDAERGYPIRLRGIVTYYHAASRTLIVQSGGDGIRIDTGKIQLALSPGREVEIEGTTGLGEFSVIVLASKLTDLTAATLPATERISIEDLSSGAYTNRRVEASGVVRSGVRDNDGRLTLNVATIDGTFQARVNSRAGAGFSDALIDSRVDVRGVARTTSDIRGRPVRLQILVFDMQDVKVLRAAPADAFSIPVRAIGTVIQAAPGASYPHRVRVQGVMGLQTDGTMLVADATGRMPINIADAAGLRSGERIDVLGFIGPGPTGIVLQDAVFRRIEDGAALPSTLNAAGTATQLPVLTTVGEILRLVPVEARRGYPVRLRAVVTSRFESTAAFIQDSTAGIFMVHPGHHLTTGQLVDVAGQTGAGDFAPVVDKVTTRVIGQAALPNPQTPTLSALFTGAYDSQWVQAEGIVQTVTRQGRDARLSVVNGKYTFVVEMSLGDHPLPSHLIDARVRVSGACGAVFNERRQLLGVRLIVPEPKYITVLEHGVADPWSLPIQPIKTLMQYSPDKAGGHRVRMQGIATLQSATGAIYIKDPTGGLVVHTQQNLAVKPGDRVDVVGFPTPGDYLPTLDDAIVQTHDAGPPTPPVYVTLGEAMGGNYHAELVQMEATLLDQVVNSTGRVSHSPDRPPHFQRHPRGPAGRRSADRCASGQPRAGHRRQRRQGREDSR